MATDDTLLMSDPLHSHLDLVRIDPSQNMARFYGIAIQPNLFGEVSVIRCWGRIGTRGRSLTVTYEDPLQAVDAFNRLERKKRRRAYVAVPGVSANGSG